MCASSGIRGAQSEIAPGDLPELKCLGVCVLEPMAHNGFKLKYFVWTAQFRGKTEVFIYWGTIFLTTNERERGIREGGRKEREREKNEWKGRKRNMNKNC